MTRSADSREEAWPSLPLESWSDTYATLHMWTQIVGKIRLVQSPWVNHSWHVTLYVTSRGLTTSPIPYRARTFQIEFDFLNHQLVIQTSDGRTGTLPLEPQSVAAFYRRLTERDGETRSARGDPQETVRSPRADKLRPGRVSPGIRSRVRESVLANPCAGRPRPQGVSRPVHRQGQSRAPFLGRHGSGGDAVFRAAGSATSRWDSQPA